MEAQQILIREQQKEIWNRFSPGWKRWDELTMDFLKPIGDEIIRMINPKGADVVLDVASGTGEPGLTIAARLTGGMVIASDLSEGMLQVARDKAALKGIKNLRVVAGDATELPFPDNSFDSISCRLGYMFFPDMLLAAREMMRVLKPGGRLAAAVWNVPEKNVWATAIMSSIGRNIQMAAPVPGAPGLFRCSGEGFMEYLFRESGMINISEVEVSGKMNFMRTEIYWDYMTDVVAPVVAALSGAGTELRAKIKDEVFESVNNRFHNGKVSFDSSALVSCAEKRQ